MAISLNQKQSQTLSQKQVLRLSQRQIASLKILSLSQSELKEEIEETAKKNPALKVSVPDAATKQVLNGIGSGQPFNGQSFGSQGGGFSSDKYYEALLNTEDSRETLKTHLLNQLNQIKELDETELECGRRLIDNLDKNGFHILEPFSVLSFLKKSSQKKEVLSKLLKILRELEPAGCCTRNFEESLFVQYEIYCRENYIKFDSDVLYYILNGHFEYLDPPSVPKILKKLKDRLEVLGRYDFLKADEKREAAFLKQFFEKKGEVQNAEIECAVETVKKLDPYPGRAYGYEVPRFISPDISVEKAGNGWKISIEKENLPSLSVRNEEGGVKNGEKEIFDANIFIDSINFRFETLTRAAQIIVHKQEAFFEKGSGNLVPFLQKDLAQALELSESTVSRLATGKYLLCQWGVFELSYFFTNSAKDGISQDKIKGEIKKIIVENPHEKLTDSKIAEKLSESGIKISRRTVSKYRNQMGLGSSFER